MDDLLIRYARTEKHEGRYGRTRSRRVMVWNILNENRVIGEYKSKREAVAELSRRELEAQPCHPGKK
jgi:hypothetical protein